MVGRICAVSEEGVRHFLNTFQIVNLLDEDTRLGVSQKISVEIPTKPQNDKIIKVNKDDVILVINNGEKDFNFNLIYFIG